VTTDYITDEAAGKNWTLLLGDACERISEIGTDTIDLSVCSPPFASLFTYSPSARDLGNSASRGEFFEHYTFIITEQLRVTKPGRRACIHVQQLTTTKSTDGYMGMTDFRGQVIHTFQQSGWIFDGEVTIWKDPQAQSIRTRSHALAFATKNRDSATSRPALADYLLLFRKPGDNQVPIKTDVTNDEWIEWAAPIWTDHHDGGWLTTDGNICPVWYGIRETDTLNTRVAKESADERHICPLQLGFIDRCVRLWSNPGELILTPFAGIGSELYQAVKLGRRAVGIELKPSYWRTAVDNLTALEAEMQVPVLFEVGEVAR
jgi:hypothetical protein